MTTEQYEGTPELIFYCEYNPNDFDDRLEISFTNEYKIELDFSRDADNQICINVDLQPKESNIPKDFFGKNILNVTAIAGKNGVGKSNILKSLFINQKILVRECLKVFLINPVTIVIEISDEHNKSILKPKISNVFDISINTQENFKRTSGEYFKQREYNSLLVSLNFNADRVKYSKYDLAFVFGRSPAYIDAVSKFWFLKETKFSELFFKKKIVPKILIIEIIEFTEKDKYISMNNVNYRVTADLLREVRNTNYMLLAWFYILFNIKSLIPEDQNAIVENTVVIDDLSDVIEALIQFLTKQDIDYTEQYFMLTSRRPVNIKKLISSLDNCFYRLKWQVKIANNDWILEIQDEDDRDVAELIGQISFLNKVVGKNIIEISLGEYSSGEDFILGQMASLYRVFNNEVINPEEIMEFKRFNSIIILIDEYEQHLHPEWSRRYLSYLFDYLNEEGDRLGIKFQLIVTTHSPYLISDLPKENIILIEKDQETSKCIANKSNYGFASNYYDIMSDSFFLDDTIGEFAKQKINGWLNEIKEIQTSKKSFEDKNKKLDQLKESLLIIGDEFLKNELIKQVNLVKDNIFNEISNVDKIAFLEKQIIELKGKERND